MVDANRFPLSSQSKALHNLRKAFRIDKCVVHGEIDNRVKGVVCGRIWLVNWPEPMVLELQGNDWAESEDEANLFHLC